MNQSANKTSNTIAKNGGGESYQWKTVPSIGTTVKGCHLVPMKAPVSMKENDISIEEGGLTIRKVKEALPGVVKVVSLRRPEWNGPMNGPKMYTREEVAEEGLLWGQVHCRPMVHTDSEPFPSEETVHQFFKEVFLNIQKRTVGTPQKCCKMTLFDISCLSKTMKKVLVLFWNHFPPILKVEVDNGLVAVHCSHGLHRGWETQEQAGKRNEVDERPGSSLTEKWGQKKNITEELVEDMAEIRQDER